MRNGIMTLSVILAIIFNSSLVNAAELNSTTKLTWHGHAAFEIKTPMGKVLLIDPWLNNPLNPQAQTQGNTKANPLKSITKLDYILVTHGHFDHTGDAVALAKQTQARLVANFELGTNMARVLGYPENLMGFDTLMNSGGKISIADAEVTVHMTAAVHSSGLDPDRSRHRPLPIVYGGNPNGFVIEIKNGPTIYHTGDTAYFKDMEQIAAFKPDVALINIGGHFGMEPEQAALCAKAVAAKLVLPHHYKTFPILTQDAAPFMLALKKSRIASMALEPGQSIEFVGNKLEPVP